MPAESFEATNFSWQLQLLRQQAGEWVALQFRQMSSNYAPDWDGSGLWPPDWVLQTLAWVCLTGLALWLGWLLRPWLRLLVNKLQRSPRRSSLSPATQTPLRSPAEWWQLAQTWQRQGNYTEACRALYLAMLQHLNDAQLVPQQASRTDGEYWQLVQRLPQPQPYQVLLRTHEQLCYGLTPISAEAFDRCQQAYREIMTL